MTAPQIKLFLGKIDNVISFTPDKFHIKIFTIFSITNYTLPILIKIRKWHLFTGQICTGEIICKNDFKTCQSHCRMWNPKTILLNLRQMKWRNCSPALDSRMYKSIRSMILQRMIMKITMHQVGFLKDERQVGKNCPEKWKENYFIILPRSTTALLGWALAQLKYVFIYKVKNQLISQTNC